MPIITSLHNEKLKALRKLHTGRRARERSASFVAEGEDLLEAADAAGWSPLERYVAAGSGLCGTEVDPEILAKVSGLASGTRALAVYAERWAPAPTGPLCIYLHAVHDPGNLGTVLRGAAAFGAASVAIGPDTADPYSPRAVRASMGAIFQIPVTRIVEPVDPRSLPGATIALVAGVGIPLREVAGRLPVGPRTLLIGSERHGLPPELLEAADLTARIPIATESLNAAMAATVALYELSLDTTMAGS